MCHIRSERGSIGPRTWKNRLSAIRVFGDHPAMEHPDWPIFGITLTTPRLVLRPVSEDDVPAVIAAIKAGIHDPATTPFESAFTDAESPDLERNTYRWYATTTVAATPEKWNLPFGVWLEDALIGVQGAHAEKFPTLRVASTGSWLRADHQGNGYGKEMRSALLTLLFDRFDAAVCESESFVDNPQSAGVSRALGYEENGRTRHAPRGEPVEAVRWRLTRERFESLRAGDRYADVAVEGAEAALPLLGLA